MGPSLQFISIWLFVAIFEIISHLFPEQAEIDNNVTVRCNLTYLGKIRPEDRNTTGSEDCVFESKSLREKGEFFEIRERKTQ